MSITTVLPPTSTPGGFFGCFGPPSTISNNFPDIMRAFPVSGQIPCGNGTVESCCILGDVCLSNGVCQIMEAANTKPLYYGSYCTDPTFTSPECARNCAVRYMAYCNENNMWQCGDTDRLHPIGCKLSDTTIIPSSTFFMVEPTKLAIITSLPSSMPTTTDLHYVPTQWGIPSARTSVKQISISTAITQTSATVQSPTSTATIPTQTSPALTNNDGLTKGDKIAIAGTLGTFIGVVVTAVGVSLVISPTKTKIFLKRLICR